MEIHNSIRDRAPYDPNRHRPYDPADHFSFRARFEHGILVELTQLEPEHKAVFAVDESAEYQRTKISDGLGKLLARDSMAVKWLVCGDINTPERPIYIEHRRGFAGVRYVVTKDSLVLASNGEWEHDEPTPPSRDDAFLKRTRHTSFDAAIAVLRRHWGTRYAQHLTVPQQT
jgi:hypothetical protein